MTDKKKTKKPAKKIHPKNTEKKTKTDAPAATPPKPEKVKPEKVKPEKANATVSRVDVSKCKPELVAKYIQQFELKPKNDTLEEQVRVLQDHQRKKTPKKKLSTACTECGGCSNLDLPECPFCGETAVLTPEELAAQAQAQQQAAAQASEGAEGQPTSLPVVAVAGGEVLNGGALADLEVNETAIRQADSNGIGSYYDKGRALLNIYRHNLWKHRLGPDGKPVYRSWGEYIQAEHSMSAKHAIQILEVAENFDRETFIEIGVSRLRQIMRYEGDDQEKLVKMAKDGMTKAQLVEYVRENPPPHRTNLVHSVAGESKGKAKGGFKGGAAAAQKGTAALKAKAAERRAKPEVKSTGEITALLMLGSHKVKLFTKKDPQKRAGTLAQEPVGVLIAPNGVELHLSLGRDSSGLNLTVKVKRPEEKGAAA